MEKDRQKLDRIYSPDLFEKLAKAFASAAKNYLKETRNNKKSLATWFEPKELTEVAFKCLSDHLSVEKNSELSLEEVEKKFSSLLEKQFLHSRRLQTPHYLGHQVPAVIPVASLFDALGSLTNESGAIYEMSPFASAVERALESFFTGFLGWQKGEGAVIFTNGGSLANLTGILAARNVKYKEYWKVGGAAVTKSKSKLPAIIASKDSHYSIARAAGILGLGVNQVIAAPLDPLRRIDVKKLPAIIDDAEQRDLEIFCIVASAGSTPVGAFDDLNAINEICRDRGIWFHVDGAHGASVLLSQKYKHLVDGIGGADTIVWDAHKMLFVPSTSTMLFYRDKKCSFEVFEQKASYLFDDKKNETDLFDGALRTIECTKHANIYPIWGVLSMFGADFLARIIETCIDNAAKFASILSETKDFVCMNKPESNILCFRHLPKEIAGADEQTISLFQTQVREKLIRQGNFYITNTLLDEKRALRVVSMNPFTGEQDMYELLEELRHYGREVIVGS